jgi:Mg2+/citrate symporter
VRSTFQRLRKNKWFWAAIAAVVALQLYFVRELVAAELLFALLFGIALIAWLVFYLVGEAGERGAELAESGVKFVSPLFRRTAGKKSAAREQARVLHK